MYIILFSVSICLTLYTNKVKLRALTGNALLIATLKRKIQVQRLDFENTGSTIRLSIYYDCNAQKKIYIVHIVHILDSWCLSSIYSNLDIDIYIYI